MVFVSRLLCKYHRAFSKGKVQFLDNVRVYVRGGGGGQGLPKYGGVGGKGGDVYMVGRKNITLRHVESVHPKRRLIAVPGANSSKHALLGVPGQDLEVDVPLGVCVKNEHGRILGDINTAGDRVLVSFGGEGGGPPNEYKGQRAVPAFIRLDLKLIADIGLVGFPNAGKSTLLKAMSRAAPRIADYPFTTITPQLGTMVYKDNRRITMADLPGLIEGAHMDIGMGHQFLKHVERTKLLLFVVDLHGFQLGVKHPHRSAFETVVLLNKELELYREDLLDKPAVLALNKMDLPDSQRHLEEVLHELQNYSESVNELDESLRPERFVQFEDIITISAKSKDSTGHLKNRLRTLLDIQKDKSLTEECSSLTTVQTDGASSSGFHLPSQSRAAKRAAEKVRLQLTEHSDVHLV